MKNQLLQFTHLGSVRGGLATVVEMDEYQRGGSIVPIGERGGCERSRPVASCDGQRMHVCEIAKIYMEPSAPAFWHKAPNSVC